MNNEKLQPVFKELTGFSKLQMTEPLSTHERTFLLMLATMVSHNDTNLKRYEITLKNLNNTLGTKGILNFDELKNIGMNLLGKTITIDIDTNEEDQEGKLLIIKWIDSMEYTAEVERIILTIHPRMFPYYMQLKQHLDDSYSYLPN